MNTHPGFQVIHDSPPPPAGVDPDLVNEDGSYSSTIVASSYFGGVTPDGVEHDWWVLLVLRPFAPYFAVLIVDPDTDSLIVNEQPHVYENIGDAVLDYIEAGGEAPAVADLQFRAEHPPKPARKQPAAPSRPRSGSRFALGLALGIAAGGG